MGFRVVPIQRRSEAVKIFLLFCVHPHLLPRRWPKRTLLSLLSLFSLAAPPVARGAMRRRSPASRAARCGLRLRLSAAAASQQPPPIRLRGAAMRGASCRSRRAYAVQWASPAGRRAAPRRMPALFSILWLPICVKSRPQRGAAFFLFPDGRCFTPVSCIPFVRHPRTPDFGCAASYFALIFVFEFCSSLKR